MKNSEIWVGQFKPNGTVFVYDPTINSNSSTVTLFLQEDAIVQQFQSHQIKRHIMRVNDEITVMVAKSAYGRWLREQERKTKKEQEKALQKTRRTYCYCGEKLYTKSHKVCERCGWIVCSQNHCNCTKNWDKG